MSLEKMNEVFWNINLNTSAIDQEYPKKFYISFDDEKTIESELELVLAVLKYFKHSKYEYSYSPKYHNENGFEVDYKSHPGLEHVIGILITE